MKKTMIFLIVAVMIFSLTACNRTDNSAGIKAEGDLKVLSETDSKDSSLYSGMSIDLEEELARARSFHFETVAGAEVLEDFFADMEFMRDEGLEFLGYGLTRQASFFFSYAGACVSALRLAAQEILGQEPAGFSDWDTIAAVNFAAPIPLQCEAIASEYKGNEERAKECREMAAANPDQIVEDAALSVITTMEQTELEALVDQLISMEEHIYWFYPAIPDPEYRTGQEWSVQYRVAYAGLMEELGQENEALTAYQKALAIDPFNPDLFALCAKAMCNAGEFELMLTYIEEGLLMDSEHALLNALAAMFWCAAEDVQLAQEYLSKALELTNVQEEVDEEVLYICDAVEKTLRGGE